MAASPNRLDYPETGKHVIVDADLRAPLFGKSNVAIGVNNLFDVYPERVPDINVINRNDGGTAFPYYSPVGFNGRFFTRA
jgi:iron complex outermembrane receptor protein